MRRSLWILFTLVACGDDAPVMVDAASMQDADAPLCQPISAVGSFYRRAPSPRIIAGSHTFTDGVDTTLLDPDLSWDGTQWHLFYETRTGSFSGGNTRGIRHATSTDLITWSYDDTPWLIPTATGDSYPSALRTSDGRFLIAYNEGPDIKIGFFSATGTPMGTPTTALTRVQVYPSATAGGVGQADLAFAGGMYHMWFSTQDCDSSGPCPHKGVGHATSPDGLQWTLDIAPVPSLLRASADPTSGGGSPTVIYDDAHCRWEMWLVNDLSTDAKGPVIFSSAGVYHATSTNGTSWTISYTQIRDLVWDSTAAGEHLGMRIGADVAMKSSGRYLIYTGFDDQNVPANSTLNTTSGSVPGVMTLNLATRDAPP